MKYLSCIYIFLIGLLIYAANTASLPKWFGAYRSIPLGDQVGHFVLIGLLSLACNILLNFKQSRATRGSTLPRSVLAEVCKPKRDFFHWSSANIGRSVISMKHSGVGVSLPDFSLKVIRSGVNPAETTRWCRGYS